MRWQVQSLACSFVSARCCLSSSATLGRPCATRAAGFAVLVEASRGAAVALHRWMLRERGRCGKCQAVLCKFINKHRFRRCDSCCDALQHRRNAYHCETCTRFTCTQCTNASRGSSVPVAPRWPQLACSGHSWRPQLAGGGCRGVLVNIRINRASVNRPCHSCSASLGYRRFAYQCDSCTRITCKQCTRDLRSGARRRSGPRRRSSPRGGITRKTRMLESLYKRPRLSPAAGTAESEVRTTEQQPVDTASADEHERAQMADEHQRGE